MITLDLTMSLLLGEQSLKSIESVYHRFYIYRASGKKVPDMDRSPISLEVYKKLNWFDKQTDGKVLDPDTFFASSHNTIRELFRKYDEKYYEGDFERYVLEKGIDYYAKKNYDYWRFHRYMWMLEDSTSNHFKSVISNPGVCNYIDSTHKIGNFMIVPKGFGFKKAGKPFNESPIKSLHELETNWGKYRENYNSVHSFEELKELFILADFYLQDKALNKELDIDFKCDSFSEIFRKLEVISELIRIRTEKICMRLEKVTYFV